MSDLRDFLDGEALSSREGKFVKRCSVCSQPEIAKEVAEYAAGRQDGTIALSVWQIWKSYFQPKRSIGNHATIETHIKMHLGIMLK